MFGVYQPCFSAPDVSEACVNIGMASIQSMYLRFGYFAVYFLVRETQKGDLVILVTTNKREAAKAILINCKLL